VTLRRKTPLVILASLRDAIHRMLHRVETTQQERRASEERYRRLVELSPDAIAVHSSGTFIFVNEACARLLGTTDAGLLIGRPVRAVVVPSSGDVALQDQPPPRAPLPFRGEERWQRLDGRIVDVEVASIATTYLGEPAIQVIARDVTARKRAADALRHAKEAAEAANRARSNFLADMSHELRAPLNAILGYSELLEEEARELERPSMIDDLRKINTAGLHLLALLNEMLDLARREAG
jgi:PAS domain S-box-containing protein